MAGRQGRKQGNRSIRVRRALERSSRRWRGRAEDQVFNVLHRRHFSHHHLLRLHHHLVRLHRHLQRVFFVVIMEFFVQGGVYQAGLRQKWIHLKR